MQELQRGLLSVEAWNRDGAQKLATGQLALVDNQINAATATMRLKAVFPNPQRLLWPNQFVKARLLLTSAGRSGGALHGAAERAGRHLRVRGPARSDGAAAEHRRGAHRGRHRHHRQGLAEGDQVVVDGQNQLRAGSKVIPRPSGQPNRAPREGEVPRADSPRVPKGPRQ